MKKKVLATLLSMAMVAGVITGCGGAGTQSAADQLEAEGVLQRSLQLRRQQKLQRQKNLQLRQKSLTCHSRLISYSM